MRHRGPRVDLCLPRRPGCPGWDFLRGSTPERVSAWSVPTGRARRACFSASAACFLRRRGRFALAGLDLARRRPAPPVARARRHRLPEQRRPALQRHRLRRRGLRPAQPGSAGRGGAAARRARRSADVGLTGFEERVPFHLSGGEKRRVALAGVLAMRPEVLLLDEPSMYLDPRGRRELIALVTSIGRDQGHRVARPGDDLGDVWTRAAAGSGVLVAEGPLPHCSRMRR